jgi:hypothetical protein
MEMSGQLHALGALALREGSKYIGGWIGPRARLDAVESNPDYSVVKSIAQSLH